MRGCLTTTPTISRCSPASLVRMRSGGAVGKMAALLLQELSDSEISNLPPTLQNKLEGILTGLQYKIDSLKAQNEQFRVDSGKIMVDICVSPRTACVGDSPVDKVVVVSLDLSSTSGFVSQVKCHLRRNVLIPC